MAKSGGGMPTFLVVFISRGKIRVTSADFVADVVDVVACWLASAPGHFRWELNCVSVLLNLLVGAGEPWRTSPQRCVWLHCAVFTEPACLHDWTWPSVSLAALQNRCHIGRFTPFERGVLLGSYLYNLPLLIPRLSHIGENIQD